MSTRLLRSQQSTSPISQVLQSMGLTRDDLARHGDKMRQFLFADDAGSLRAFGQESSDADGAKTPTQPPLKRRSSSRSVSLHDASAQARPVQTPATPVEPQPAEAPSSARRYDSMEAVIERQNKSKRGKRTKRERDLSPPSQPRSMSRSASRQDTSAPSRVSRRASFSEDQVTPQNATVEVRASRLSTSLNFLTIHTTGARA